MDFQPVRGGGNDRHATHYRTWLKRVRRRLSASGGISQAAARLAAGNDGDAGHWRARLETLLDGTERPTLELVTRIDSLLATPEIRISESPAQGLLFPAAETPIRK